MRLSKKWVDKLVNLPEAGMAYQVVDVILEDSRTIQGLIVLGCQDILGHVSFSESDIVDITISNP